MFFPSCKGKTLIVQDLRAQGSEPDLLVKYPFLSSTPIFLNNSVPNILDLSKQSISYVT